MRFTLKSIFYLLKKSYQQTRETNYPLETGLTPLFGVIRPKNWPNLTVAAPQAPVGGWGLEPPQKFGHRS